MGSNSSKHISKFRRRRPTYPLAPPTTPTYPLAPPNTPVLFPSRLILLPNELLLEIANYLAAAKDLSALMLVNKRLALLLAHLLSDALLAAYQTSEKHLTLFSVVARYPILLVSHLVRLDVDLNMAFCTCDGAPHTNHGCMPALHIAIWASNVTMVDALLRYGARINVPHNTTGDTAVHFAIKNAKYNSWQFDVATEADLTILQMLLDGGRLQTMNHPTSLNNIGRSWLSEAVISCPPRYATIVELFLSDGLCVDAADQEKQLTALHFAVMYNRLDLVTLLLNQGADYRMIDSRGWTPFAIACNRPNCALINLFLRWDATLIDTVLNERGETAEGRLEREILLMGCIEEYEEEPFQKDMAILQRMLLKWRKLLTARRSPFVTDSALQAYYDSL